MNDNYILTYFYGILHKRLNKEKLTNIPEDILIYLNNRYNDSSCIEETLQRIKLNYDVHPICVCGKPCKYIGGTRFFLNSCGNVECSKIINQQHLQQTCLIKYGVSNPAKLNDIKEKQRQTCINKYGYASPLLNDKIHKKTIKTNKIKYGEQYAQSSDIIKKKISESNKSTCIKKYNVDNIMKVDGVKQKQQETVFKKYGVDNVFKSDEIKEKVKQTCLKLYGVECACKNELIKQKIIESRIKTSLKKYGTIYPSQAKIIKDKIRKSCKGIFSRKTPAEMIVIVNRISETKRKNNTWNTSTIEQQLIQYFDDNNINYKYQYKSELYPYCCDFYFPNKDLYVEIQGSWTHGNKPYENTIEDNIILNKWKQSDKLYYKNAINTWTIRDVQKREIAKQNNLNYLEIFSINLNTCIEMIQQRL